MAHKTLIDGTAYTISGGKALVDGTAYSIKNGKTLVGGTAYGVEFTSPNLPPTAMLYSDGSLVFQLGDAVDSTHGTLRSSFTGFDTDVYEQVSSVPWYSYRYDISKVVFKDKISPISTGLWFYMCNSATDFDLRKLDTSNVTSMRGMFYYCKSVTTLDLSNFNTNNVINMDLMFSSCSNLTKIYASERWSVDNVTSGWQMFSSCTSLVGAIAYDSSKNDHSYANYSTGYFTYKAAT